MKIIIIIFFSFLTCAISAQEPSFSQYFQTPLLINPANAGSSYHPWKFNNIFKQQRFGQDVSFNSGITSVDFAPITNSGFGFGTIFLYDQTLGGIVKNVTSSLNLSFSVFLDEENLNKLSIGFAGIYGNRRIDFNKLSFGNQFITSGGFDQTIASGESKYNSSVGYFTTGSGLIFNHSQNDFSYEIGVGGFNLNKPKASLLNDTLNTIDKRFTASGKLLFTTKNKGLVEFNSVFQLQHYAHYFEIGAMYNHNYFLSEGNASFIGGLFFKSNYMIAPLIGIKTSGLQIMCSYDINLNLNNTNYLIPKTFEISLNLFPKN